MWLAHKRSPLTRFFPAPVTAASPALTNLEPLFGTTKKTGIIYGTVASINPVPLGILPAVPSRPLGAVVIGCGDLVEDEELGMHDAVVDGGSAASAPPHPCAHDFRILTITLPCESVADDPDAAADVPEATISILWVPCYSPAVECMFVMQRSHFDSSVALDTRPGTSVRSMFAVSIGSLVFSLTAVPLTFVAAQVQTEGSAVDGEWYEGRVYGEEARHEDKARGWTRSRYLALKVVWVRAGPINAPWSGLLHAVSSPNDGLQYEQDAYTQRWCVEHLQTSNELSPWDVSFKSPFILPGANNAQCFETPSLASAEDLIAYVSALECAAPFCREYGSQS